MTVLSAFGFTTQAGATKTVGQVVELTGAQSSASAGFLTETGATTVQLSPFGFTQQSRVFSGKLTGDNVTVSLTGAAIQCQAEQLDGASYFITPDSGAALAEAGIVTDSADQGTQILNPDAQTRAYSGSEIDDRTGFRVLPGQLVRDDYSGNLVHPRYRDAPQEQERVRSARNTPQRGPQAPELDDVFLSGGVLLTADGEGFILFGEGGAIKIND